MSDTRTTIGLHVEPSQWEGLFDRIEVWRSVLTEAGPFEELTGPDYLPARLPTDAPEPPSPPQTGPRANIAGLDLRLLVMRIYPIKIIFSGPNPLTFAAAASQIQAQGQQLLRSYVVGNQLVIETVQRGRVAALELVGGDAAPLLRLPTQTPSSIAYGRDARLALLEDVTSYSFVDPYGDKKYIYKTRFQNAQTQEVSEFSAPPTLVTGLDLSMLARGFVRLVDMAGKPLVARNVLVQNSFEGAATGGVVVAGGAQEQLTDKGGYAEFVLVRGITVNVAIAGTNLVRRITVPTDPAVDLFDMLDPGLGEENDLFKVRVPQIEHASRRTL